MFKYKKYITVMATVVSLSSGLGMMSLDAKAAYVDSKVNLDYKLFEAASTGDIIGVKGALEGGAKVNAVTDRGSTSLHLAAIIGNAEVLDCLLRKGADVNLAINGWTPLHSAVRSGKTAAVKLLLDNGAGVNLVDNEGWTPLYWAVYFGYTEVAEVLIKYGANVDAMSHLRWTPLRWAEKKGYTAIAMNLLKAGANTNAKDLEGNAPLHYYTKDSHMQKEHIEVVNLIIARGGDVNAVNKDGWTPLHFAAFTGNTTVVKCLLINDAKINLKDRIGWVPSQWGKNKKTGDLLQKAEVARDEGEKAYEDFKVRLRTELNEEINNL